MPSPPDAKRTQSGLRKYYAILPSEPEASTVAELLEYQSHDVRSRLSLTHFLRRAVNGFAFAFACCLRCLCSLCLPFRLSTTHTHTDTVPYTHTLRHSRCSSLRRQSRHCPVKWRIEICRLHIHQFESITEGSDQCENDPGVSYI